MMQRLSPYLLAFTLVLASLARGQSDPYREYCFLFGSSQELEVIATAGTSLNKVFQDIYFKGLESRLPEKIRPVTETIWSAYWSFFFSLWPHEFGHRARARQVGGDFIIESFGFPFPRARMDLPETLPPEEEILPSIGGHEVNHLMMRQAHTDFYQKGFGYSLDLVHSFIQEVYYPFYAFVVAPADPTNSSTWTDTRGDPVESALTVYRSYYDRPPVRPDGSVDPDLIRYYREAVYLSVLWTLLDPMLYQSARGFGADMDQDYGLMRPWLLGGERFAWTWGTAFHPSPLGYELYLTGYLRVKQRLVSLYIQGGRPYKNRGIGIYLPGLVATGKFRLGAAGDLWDQDL